MNCLFVCAFVVAVFGMGSTAAWPIAGVYGSIKEYHFHVYFDQFNMSQVADAIAIRNSLMKELVNKSMVTLPLHFHYDPMTSKYTPHNDTTGLNMRPVGPHPVGSFETWVPVESFSSAYEWFIRNRRGLAVLIHPLTKEEFDDHTIRAVWMGKSYQLKTSVFADIIPNFGSQYPHLGLGYASNATKCIYTHRLFD